MSLNPTEQDHASENTLPVSEESGRKFALDGSARLFLGATVVCHLPDSGLTSTIHRAIIDNCFNREGNELLKDYYVLLPAPSLHMTLLDMIVYKHSEVGIEETRKTRTADVLRFRQAFLDTDCQSELRKNIPVRMEVDLSPSRYATRTGPLVVPVKPCDEGEAGKLRAIRNALASAFDIPSTVDPSYGFHITAYYPLRHLSDTQFSVLRQSWSEAVSRVATAVPTFDIGRIELCSFDDMCHFEVEEFV